MEQYVIVRNSAEQLGINGETPGSRRTITSRSMSSGRQSLSEQNFGFRISDFGFQILGFGWVFGFRNLDLTARIAHLTSRNICGG